MENIEARLAAKRMRELRTPFCTALLKRAVRVTYDHDMSDSPYCAYIMFEPEEAGTPAFMVENEEVYFDIFEEDSVDATESYSIHYKESAQALLTEIEKQNVKLHLSAKFIETVKAAIDEAFPG